MKKIRTQPYHRLLSGPMTVAAIALILLIAVSGCADDATKAENYKERARQFASNGQYRESVLELKNALQINPDDYDAYYQLAEVYIKMEKFALAADTYAVVIDIDPENTAAHYKMGHFFLAAGRFMEARKSAKLIIEKMPTNTDAYQLLAAVQVQEQNEAAAIQTLREAIAIAPKALMPHLFLAHLLADAGNPAEAQAIYMKVISDHPSDSVAYLELANIYGRNDRWEDARAIIDRMEPVGNIDTPKLTDTARFFEGRKQWDVAEALYVKGAESATGEKTAPLMDLGAFYARRGARDKALSFMQEALGRKAGDPLILSDIARVHMDAGDIKAAEAAIDAALETNPEFPDANQLKGEIFFDRKEYAQAIQRFDLTITRDPTNYRAYYFKALCLDSPGMEIQPKVDLFRTAAGFHDDNEGWIEKLVEDNLLEALALKPDLLNAKLMLAEVYLRKGYTDKAREQIDGAREQSPDHMETLSLLSSLKIMQGDLTGAEVLCKEVLARHPNLGSWHSMLGIVYMRMHRPEEAITAFWKALDLNPDQLAPLKLLTEIHLREKDFVYALKDADRHKKRLKNNRIAVAAIDNLEGAIYIAWEKPSEARRHFEAAIAGAPDFIPPRMGLAAIHLQQNDIHRAVGLYEAILSINENYLPACMALGDIHYEQGDKNQAEVYYRRALAIKPDLGLAANNLAYLLSPRDDKLSEAFELARLAKLQMPNDPTVRDTYGWIYYRMGHYVHATEELQSSLTIDPDSALTNYHLGMVYYRQDRFNEARGLFKKALEIDANFEGADEARSLLD